MDIRILNESTAQIFIDAELYSTEVIHKCFYWYSDNYSVDIKKNEGLFIINIAELSLEGNIENIFDKIKTDLIDFKTREIVSLETKNIRDMLVAKAFAHGAAFDEDPPNDLDYPIGFDINQVII